MGAKFRFRLQVVLEQRERVERDRRLALAGLERERLAVEARLRQHQRDIAESNSDLRLRLGAGVRWGGRGGGSAVVVPEVRLQAGASLHLAAKARLAALELAGVYRRIERAREELLQASRARRAVELLRDRRMDEWRTDQRRAEGQTVDEVATQAFLRERRSEGGTA